MANFASLSLEATPWGCLALSLSTLSSALCWNGSRPNGSGIGEPWAELGLTMMWRVVSKETISRPVEGPG